MTGQEMSQKDTGCPVFTKGVHVRHRRTGWTGFVFGAGPGKKPERWLKPKTVYVIWLHRPGPGTQGHSPDELDLIPANDRLDRQGEARP